MTFCPPDAPPAPNAVNLARCQAGCDYDFAAIVGVNGSTGTLAVNGYNVPGDSRFELRLNLAGSPALLALIQTWIAGVIQPGDFIFVDSTWGAPSVSTGAAFIIGEWMLDGTTPDVFGTEVRFMLDLTLPAPCDLAQFVGFNFDVLDINTAWLVALAIEQRDNSGFLPGPSAITFNGAATLSRSPNTEIQVVKICDTQPIRTSQASAQSQMDYRRIDGQVVNLDTLSAESVTVTVIAGVVQAGRGNTRSVMPPGTTFTWTATGRRGALANVSDNAVAATERGFFVDASAAGAQAALSWTWTA